MTVDDVDFDANISRRDFLGRAAALGVAVPLIAHLPDTAEAQTTPRRGGRFRVGVQGGPNEVLYAPIGTPLYIDGFRQVQVFEPLLEIGLRPNGPLKGFLAESFVPSKANTRWTLRLRKDVTFHNGKPLTARDVLYTFRLLADKANGYAYGANLVENLNLQASRVVDRHTLLLVQNRPTLDPDVWSTAVGILPQGFRDFTNPIGTGPFVFRSFTPGDRALFTRNARYWMPGKPYLNEVEIISFADPAAKLNALLGGQIDAMDGIPPAQARALANNRRIKILRARGSLNTAPQFTMRIDQKPFDDRRVREAMKLAIDRRSIVDRILLGYGAVHNDVYYSPLDPFFNKRLAPRKYEPARASSLIRSAGHNRLDVELVVFQGLEDAAALYKASAARSDINIDIKVLEVNEFWSTAYLNAPFTVTTWGSTGFHGFYQQCCVADAAYNETKMVDAQMERLVLQAERTYDRKKRTALLWELQRLFSARSGYILPAVADNLDAVARNVFGIKPTLLISLGGANFRDTWKS